MTINHCNARLVLLPVLCVTLFLLAGCNSRSGLIPGPTAGKDNAFTEGGSGDIPVVTEFEYSESDIPEGFYALDSFTLKSLEGEFSGPVEVTIRLSEPITPGTRVYLYRVMEDGSVIPVGSGVVGEDGRTIVFLIEEEGRYLILILLGQLEEATKFKVWAYADLAEGALPVNVNFFAFHDGGIEPVTFEWQFDDSEMGEGEHVAHEYISEGEYSVKLTATDGGGRISEFTSTALVILENPAGPLSVVLQIPQPTGEGYNYQFVATVSGGVAPFTFFWDFGDGTTSNEENPLHDYEKSGIYRVYLTVTDYVGNIVEQLTQVVDTRSLLFSADPFAGQRDLDVLFTVLAEGDVVYPTEIILDFGDDNNEILDSYEDELLIVDSDFPHTYNVVDTYTAALTMNTIFEDVNYTLTEKIEIIVGGGTPVITTVTPDIVLRETSITIVGAYFESEQGEGTLSLAGTGIAVTAWSDNIITFDVPLDAPFAMNELVVTNTFGISSLPATLEVIPPNPMLDSIVPTSGPVGTLVRVRGANFGDGSESSLFWNGAAIQTESWSDTEVTFLVPPSTVNGFVSVNYAGKSSIAVFFKVIPNPPDWGGGGLGQI